MSGRYSLRREKKRIYRKLLLLVTGIVFVGIAGMVVYKYIDQKQVYSKDDFAAGDAYNTVEINGIKCRPKTRVKSYLFMGIDTYSKMKTPDNEASTGQCDVLQLIVIDQNADTYAILPINRDTVTAVKTLEEDGTYVGTSKVQIALAHANGDGAEISCENTVDAVSNLLYGQKIDGYAALSMDSIGVLNHMAGGVPVTIEDDFSKADPSLIMGETITLSDEQAVNFVRGRMSVGDGTNENRMKRQEQYLSSAVGIFKEKFTNDETYVLDVYEALQDYMVTTLTGKDFSKLSKAVLKNKSLGEFQIEGKKSEDYLGYSQYIVDQDSLADIVIELFYDRV